MKFLQFLYRRLFHFITYVHKNIIFFMELKIGWFGISFAILFLK